MRMSVTSRSLLVPALLLLVAGCNDKTGRTASKSANTPAVGTSVGQRAPEIEGSDINGIPFKLSDYRGKVVVLDFWGHW